ncbi:MAG TPA: LysR family transcriptional regulator [Steroidobacteraceae bacterium]|nr:LysR family transcriptional regulator [Steroidobacteraceae bacterium]
MDRFEALTAFVAVANAGGFSAAGRELGIPLPTISRRVIELEETLGARLFHRTTRRVELTEQGKTFFAACQRVLEDLKDAEEALGGEYRTPKGELSITAPVGFGRLHVQPVALEFLANYPEINLRLLLVDRVVNLLEEHIDAALRIADLPDSSLVARALGHIQMLVCASPKYLRRRGKPTHPRELIEHDCIAWSTLLPVNSWWFREDDADVTFPIRVRLSTTISESALAAAESGLGLLQTTSYQAASALHDKRLVRVLSEYDCAATPVTFVYPSSRLVPLKLRAFLDFATPRLSRRLRRIGQD